MYKTNVVSKIHDFMNDEVHEFHDIINPLIKFKILIAEKPIKFYRQQKIINTLPTILEFSYMDKILS